MSGGDHAEGGGVSKAVAQRPEIDDAVALGRRSVTLALLTLVYFFSFMDRQILSILLEAIKADLQLSDTELGLLSGLVFAIFYATLGIPIARLADRSSRRNIIAVSLAVWSLMTAACGLAQTFTQLMLARVGVGVGEAGAGPPSHSIIADLYPPDRRASAMAIYSLGVLLGGGLGVMIGGNVASLYGWRAAMFVVGLPGLLLAVIVRLVMVEPRRGLSDVDRVVEQSAHPSLADGVASIWRSAPARHLIAAITLTSLVGYALTGWGPSYMQRSLGYSMREVANYVALPAALIGAASALIGGKLADRAARRRGVYAQSWVVVAMKAIGFPFAVAFYFVDAPDVALGCYFVSYIFAGAYLGPTFAMIQHLAPLRLRATWAALSLLSINLLGLGLGPYLVGQLSDWLRPTFGAQSLRYAMLGVSLLTPWTILHYARAATLMKRAEATVSR